MHLFLRRKYKIHFRLSLCLFILFLIFLPLTSIHAQTAQHGLALHGDVKYSAAFTHFDYVNPDAPKGGDLHLSSIGTFDTVNPFTLKGVAADGAGSVFETLMASSLDEPFSEYGWVAESVTVAPDRGWVAYQLRPEAKFSDGSPVTPDDIIFSFETLRDKGHPFYRGYYKDVVKAEKTGPQGVKFTFRDTTNTELPLIMGQLPVLSKKSWRGRDFAATTLDSVLGSGPYKIENMIQGRTITLARDKNWWGKDLPVNKGRYNFDHIVIDYYRDSTVASEAFFAGRYDYRFENIAKNWALNYNTPAVQQGLIKKEVLKNELPAGMQGFVMNIRRPLFQDARVRQALDLAFDFEWSNKNFAYNSYTRTQSYFDNSELAATGLPSADELKLLEPWRGKIPDQIFTAEYKEPKSDGSGDDRDNLHQAADLLKQGGWTLKDGTLTNAKGETFTLELLVDDAMFERWVQPWFRNLERLGIKPSMRVVDASQYQNRMNDFDFDMTIAVFSQGLSPGNEQTDYWESTRADSKGSRNLIGVKDPAVDAMVGRVVHAQSREDLVTACRALDRILLWKHLVVPQWHLGNYRIAFWDKFGRPPELPKYAPPGSITDGWWSDSAKAGKINAAQKRN